MSAESIADRCALRYPEYKEQYSRGGLRLKFGDDVLGITRSLKRSVKEEVREVNGSDVKPQIISGNLQSHGEITHPAGVCFHTNTLQPPQHSS